MLDLNGSFWLQPQRSPCRYQAHLVQLAVVSHEFASCALFMNKNTRKEVYHFLKYIHILLVSTSLNLASLHSCLLYSAGAPTGEAHTEKRISGWVKQAIGNKGLQSKILSHGSLNRYQLHSEINY